MKTNTIIWAQLFEYSNNPNIRGNTVSDKELFDLRTLCTKYKEKKDLFSCVTFAFGDKNQTIFKYIYCK